ncbi:cadmium-translocating P-type ATPase [Metarhizobium album]|uniref:Cadmium-translocating P-type ATPase n=1 Tax=Metarhizobium album TaxID=2182425 RepID=A0A2U2DMT8_9HYPH|nr:heavy metal translocating P-type ATPase [Rhizobium album]PWE54628.1 cadmium-translocating P-type ATPase [Rhizobium album]
MSCCAPVDLSSVPTATGPAAEELALSSRDLGNGLRQTILAVPDMRCGACLSTLENVLRDLPEVEMARANLTTKRVTVNWRAATGEAPNLAGIIASAGYTAHLPGEDLDREDRMMSFLLRALAVAGFCSMNIMGLSVSVWAGADPDTRAAFHLLSAVLALPAVLYSGSIYYTSAWKALSHGKVNMDVPVSIGVLLSFGLSLYDTLAGAPHAYFEASTSLLFVLLVGRTLEHLMRRRARSASAALVGLMPSGAMVVAPDGSTDYLPLTMIAPGMRLRVAAGDRIPVDAIVRSGSSSLDRSFITGESRSQPADEGGKVHAGDLNLANPLTIEATATPDTSTVAELARLLEGVENGRDTYRSVADRAAQLYAPVVHSLSACALLFWWFQTGDFHLALTISISVLIITCPCALGLAVPMVQVVAARRLFEQGIVVKEGSALERLARIDTVVFDKTGTLTTSEPKLLNGEAISSQDMALAAAMASHSRHPLAKAIAAFANPSNSKAFPFTEVREHAGSGIEARLGDDRYALGRRGWATPATADGEADDARTVLGRNGKIVAAFVFGERLRAGAARTVRRLKGRGLGVHMLTGDTSVSAKAVAIRAGIDVVAAGVQPQDKVAYVRSLQSAGKTVLMVGDGINDAAALAAAHASIAPASGSDIGRSSADVIMMRDSLEAVVQSLSVSKSAARLIRQNFALAVAYNVVSIPIALTGHATPLIAAIAMSASSLTVVVNALRLGVGEDRPSARERTGLAAMEPAE